MGANDKNVDSRSATDDEQPPSKKHKVVKRLKIKTDGVPVREKKVQKLKCDICKKTCKSVRELNKHTRQHIPKFKCHVCDRKF